MSVDDIDSLDLKRKSIEILQALALEGGESNTTDLRKNLNFDDRHTVTYRVNEYLEPAGLVEAHQPEGDGSTVNPPKEMTLTEAGREFVEAIDEQGLYGRIADRLDRLEKQVNGLREENQELRQENQELREIVKGSDVEMITGRVQTLEDEVDELQITISNLQDALGDLNVDPVVGNSFAPTAINTGYLLGNVARELLIEEYGEDRVMELVEEKQSKLEAEDKMLDS